MPAAVLSVDMATAAFNNYFDYRRGVDTKASDLISDKVLVHKPLNPRSALCIAAGFYLLAAALGLAIAKLAGFEIVALGALCMAIPFFYSGEPYPIAARPVGERFAGGFLGLVLVALSAYVQLGELVSGAVLLGIPSTLSIASILTVNNTCDIEGDRLAGRRTLSIMLGDKAARRLIYGLGITAYALAFLLIQLAVIPPISAPFLALAAVHAGIKYRKINCLGYSAGSKGRVMPAVSRVLITYTAALILGMPC